MGQLIRSDRALFFLGMLVPAYWPSRESRSILAPGSLLCPEAAPALAFERFGRRDPRLICVCRKGARNG